MGQSMHDFDPEPEGQNESLERIEELSREKERAENERNRAEEARAQAEQEKAEAEEAKSKAEGDRKHAEEVVRLAEQEKAQAEEAARSAEQSSRSLQAQIVALEQGIEADFIPTPEEIQQAKQKIRYSPGCLHFAVAGWTGTGKSSLINALRGITDIQEGDSAKVGTSETTTEITTYEDRSKKLPFCRFRWSDIPGAGTQTTIHRNYAKSQALYIFDIVILVVGDRFLEYDATILKHCRLLKVPTFIVRSKADVHIWNIERVRQQMLAETTVDSDESDDDDEGVRDRHEAENYAAAENDDFEMLSQSSPPMAGQESGVTTPDGESTAILTPEEEFPQCTPEQQLRKDTEMMIWKGLDNAGLNVDRKVYLVSSDGMRWCSQFARAKPGRPKVALLKKRPVLYDAQELLRDALEMTYQRRYNLNSFTA